MLELPIELVHVIERSLWSNSRTASHHRATMATSLSRDIWFVATALRTATLIDVISFDHLSAHSLASSLRTLAAPTSEHLGSARTAKSPSNPTPRRSSSSSASLKLLQDLVVVHELVSGQTLVVNRRLLGLRHDMPLFIDVSGRKPKVIDPPSIFTTLLGQLRSHDLSEPIFHLELPSGQPPSCLIPLAGYLLDYSMVYCLECSEPDHASAPNCLGGIDLTLISVELVRQRRGATETAAHSYVPTGRSDHRIPVSSDGDEAHRSSDLVYPLLSFSYPSSSVPPGASPIPQLESIFQNRLTHWPDHVVRVRAQSGINMPRFVL